MLDRKPRMTENQWRWFRHDPALAQAMQAVLQTGEGGDIITAMRSMSPQALIETIGIAYGDLCEEAGQAYQRARQRADQWAFWQLLLGIATVVVILLSMVASLLSLSIASASSAAVSFVTGTAAMWFDSKVEENRKEAEARFQDMVRYCTQSKLMLQFSHTLEGLEPEQQEQFITSVLGLSI